MKPCIVERLSRKLALSMVTFERDMCHGRSMIALSYAMDGQTFAKEMYTMCWSLVAKVQCS